MTDRTPWSPLDPDRLDRVLAPFAADGGGLRVTVEDLDGATIAGSPSPRPASGHAGADGRTARDIESHGTAVGRLVATGPATADPVVAATLDALAIGLGELADASTRIPPSELALGRLHQRSIVSLRPPDVPGYDLASHYEAAREIGGDFFELFRLRRRRRTIGVVIADVTGKGIAAGLMMAFARPVIHAALDAAPGPAVALERTNRILVEELHTRLFITALVGSLDAGSGRLRVANAGHEPPLLVPADGGPIQNVTCGGLLLGAFTSLGLAEVEVSLDPGDLLLLYTDGVTDAADASAERFGEPRLYETLDATRGRSAHEVVAAIRDAVASFRGAVEPTDDITIVAVGRHR
jgi:serine phosphatase RsbU (regulator of sigma subunit)